MDRRGFLKGCAVLAAAPLFGIPSIRLIEPAELILPAETWFATIRELVALDVMRGRHIVRYDALCGAMQLGIDFELSLHDPVFGLAEARTLAAKRLARELHHRHINPHDLRPLPIPDWYSAPAWQTTNLGKAA